MRIGRRALLRGAVGAVGLSSIAPLARLMAAEASGHRLVACYFSGGWDVLLGPDPRDPAGSYPGINLGTDILAAEYRDPFPVVVGGREVLWGAPMQPLVAHRDLITVINGVNMNTVAHPTGRAYSNTGIAPAGSVARGSSLGTVFAAGGPVGPDGPVLPNLSIGITSYNADYNESVNAVRINRSRDLGALLGPPSRDLGEELEALLAAAQDEASSCVGSTYRGHSPEDELRLSRERRRRLQRDNVSAYFDFAADTPEMNEIRALYGFAPTSDDRTPQVAAATAAQIIRNDMSRAVSVQLQKGLDSHSNWVNHPGLLRTGFEALGNLLTHLRMDDPALERTTVMAFSEFSRTPRINGSSGRDHWFANSFMVFGSTLRNMVYGATNTDDLGLVEVDLATGLPDPIGGQIIKPEHVYATLVASVGLDPTPYRVDPIGGLIVG